MEKLSFLYGILLVLFSSCMTPPAGTENPGEIPGTRRTIVPAVYDGWEMKKFDYIGLWVDFPKQAKTSPSARGVPDLTISLHFLPYPFWVPLDATVFVEIYITRMPIGKLEKEIESTKRSSLFKESPIRENRYWIWRDSLQEKISRWDEFKNYTFYRRDVRLDNGEIFHAYAEVLNGGSKESIEADHAAVRRIFNSIKPLGKKHAKK